jgi:transcriptional regulator with XRE-family HTH domain
MSPRRIRPEPTEAAALSAIRVAVRLGGEIHDERVRRHWLLKDLAREAGVSPSMVADIEAGKPATIGGYARLAHALDLVPRFSFHSERSTSRRDRDAVHSAMGEVEARRLRPRGLEVLIDEPYQHYQFAGRADLVAIDRARRALLHLENRTRFPDIQDFAGTFNAKRAYLAADLARRHGLPPFDTVTHVVAALWSAEVIHVVRRRLSTFQAVCPDPADVFEGWWSGDPPVGTSTTFVLLDPVAVTASRRRAWVGLRQVPVVRPRYRGYANALIELRAAGLV